MKQLLSIINELRGEQTKVTDEEFETYLKGHHVSPENVICSLSGVSEEELLQHLARKSGIEFITFEQAANLISEQQLKDAYQQDVNWQYLAKLGWYPLSFTEDKLTIVTNRPFAVDALNYLAYENVQYTLALTSESLLQRVVTLYEQTQEVESSSIVEVERLRAMASEAPIVNLVNSLINRALEAKSSDMHIEPVEQGGRVRVRVDGVLQKLDDIPKNLLMPVVSRIKILADLDIAEKRRPQDGKIALHHLNIDIRASVLPLNNGESVVMRFLEKGSLRFDMQELGFEPDTIELINQDLTRTAGVILMTGPTGSGKTTTLYSFLQQLNSSHEKIITLEDPVEYELEGVNQIQVNSDIGFDFSAGLRSIVRQDPDVIMVGEIRDAETARIAMQSSLTGHLVFSTVHTNDAPSAYVRLIDLGVDEFLLNASVIAIIAQRLVRKLCSHCCEVDDNKEQLIAKLKQTHNVVLNSESTVINRAVGCDKCNGTGYKGRLALIEYLPNDDHIKALSKNATFTLSAEDYMRQKGFRNLFEDGIVKVAKGLTTIEEVVRVAG